MVKTQLNAIRAALQDYESSDWSELTSKHTLQISNIRDKELRLKVKKKEWSLFDKQVNLFTTQVRPDGAVHIAVIRGEKYGCATIRDVHTFLPDRDKVWLQVDSREGSKTLQFSLHTKKIDKDVYKDCHAVIRLKAKTLKPNF